MSISFATNFFTNTAAQTLARLGQVAARPDFELRFFEAQNRAIERFNKEIEKFQKSDFGRSKTALLRIKAKRLENALSLASTYKTYAVTNRQTVKDILDQLAELRALADPNTVAEFDAKRAEALDSIEKLRTSDLTGLGAPEGLVDLKPQAEAVIEGIVHNNFATADDITNAQTTIDSLSLEFTGKLEILELNQDIATTLVNSKDRVLAEVTIKIDDIEIAERKQAIDRIQAREAELSRIFTAFSLAFEGSQFLNDFITNNTVFDPEPEPGSVLNLFA
jgi:hypothetical protein